MTTIKAYLYPNTCTVQILDTSIFTTKERKVYSRPITVYQGIDNPIQIVVKNQDQKRVNLTGYAVQADIQDPVNQVTVESYAVTWANISIGQGSFTISKETVNSLEQRIYKLTVKAISTDDNSEKPVYIDDNFGVPLDIMVLPAYYSVTAPSPGVDNSVIDGGNIE
jgi:hypothetical protein